MINDLGGPNLAGLGEGYPRFFSIRIFRWPPSQNPTSTADPAKVLPCETDEQLLGCLVWDSESPQSGPQKPAAEVGLEVITSI